MAADPNQRLHLLELACRHNTTPQAVLNAAKAYEEWVFGMAKTDPGDRPNVQDIEDLIAIAKRQTLGDGASVTRPEELP